MVFFLVVYPSFFCWERTRTRRVFLPKKISAPNISRAFRSSTLRAIATHTIMQEHFDKGAANFLAIAKHHQASVLESLASRGKPKRGAHLVEVREDWLGLAVVGENGFPKIWSKDRVDGVEALFVQRKQLRKALPGIQANLLTPLLEKVDGYNPRKQLVFFIFVSGPNIKRAHVNVI